jgi:hypothetical protein
LEYIRKYRNFIGLALIAVFAIYAHNGYTLRNNLSNNKNFQFENFSTIHINISTQAKAERSSSSHLLLKKIPLEYSACKSLIVFHKLITSQFLNEVTSSSSSSILNFICVLRI